MLDNDRRPRRLRSGCPVACVWYNSWLHVALGLLVSASCKWNAASTRESVVTGAVVGERAAGGSLRVAYGKGWVVGGDIAATSAGTFSVPTTAKAVVAYNDVNRNGKFDRFSEPSGDCRLADGSWRCLIPAQRATLHRSIATRGRDSSDKTFVFWEDFGADGLRVKDSRLCMDGRCTHQEPMPFLSRASHDVEVFSICGEEGFAPQEATVQGHGQALAVPVAHPERFDPVVRVERARGDLILHISNPGDRVIVWGGTIDSNTEEISRVYWSSEDADIDVIATSTELEIRIPAAKVNACQRERDCRIGAQLLKYWNGPDATLISATEYRTSVEFRGVL